MPKNTNLALILDDIRSTHNVGSIFRSADCFGISHIYISGYTPYPSAHNDPRLPHIANKLDAQITKTALGAEKTVPFSLHTDIKSALIAAREEGYQQVVGLEQTTTSVPLHKFRPHNNLVLILGNEVEGIPAWTISQCSAIIEIEQHGSKESLNVANAASVAMYAIRTAPNKKI